MVETGSSTGTSSDSSSEHDELAPSSGEGSSSDSSSTSTLEGDETSTLGDHTSGSSSVTSGASTGSTHVGPSDTESSDSGGTGDDPSDARFPFPQDIASQYCVHPTNRDSDDVRAAYELWKTTVVTDEGAGGYLRVRKPDSGTVIGSTVSEGIGYGMLAAVYMDDQDLFDNLWQYARLYFNGNGLMEWEVDPSGTVIGSGAALDGDEDMAWALVMADRQWGAGGSLPDTYLNHAIDLIQAMWDHEIDHQRGDMPLPGDQWGGADITNVSYFAPSYYRVFGEVSGNTEGWNRVVDRSYEILELSLNEASGNADNGLVPAWCDSNGVPTAAYEGAPLHFQNDSTRTPFRIGHDYCENGEPRALAYMQKITSFYTAVGVDAIVDGYDLDGTPRPDFSMNGLQPASFVGPAGVGAMYAADNQAFIDDAYSAVASGELTAGTIYYQKSWSVLSLLMMTGNFTEFPPSP